MQSQRQVWLLQKLPLAEFTMNDNPSVGKGVGNRGAQT